MAVVAVDRVHVAELHGVMDQVVGLEIVVQSGSHRRNQGRLIPHMLTGQGRFRPLPEPL